MSDFQVAVIGAGVAGLTAARRMAEGGARVVVFDRRGMGGQVSTVEGIVNFPGKEGEPVAGYELGLELMEAAESQGALIRLDDVPSISRIAGGFALHGAEELQTDAIVIAAGSRRRLLEVPGEQEWDGRGLSHCASCDGPFFRGKRVIVVGGGDSAFDEARLISDHAREVMIVHSGASPSARPSISEPTLARPNVRVRSGATVTALRGEARLEAVVIRDLTSGDEHLESTDGMFVYIGLKPDTEVFGDLVDLDETGHIVVDADLATSVDGIYAAGDIRSGTAAMLEECVADGELVARSVLARLTTRGGTRAPCDRSR